MEGFLSLTQAAVQLDLTLEFLQGEIQAGRVVAIIRDEETWLSPGEVSRLAKAGSSTPAPLIESPSVAPPPARTVTEASTTSEPTAPPEASPPRAEAPGAPPRTSAPTPPLAPKETPRNEAEDELRQRYDSLLRQFAELEKVNQRLKLGLQETEATLRRNRTAKANLESDIINLQENLKRSQTRSTALEREVQHLTHQLERAEEKHSSEMRKLRPHERSSDNFAAAHPEGSYSQEEVRVLRQQMEEKDRIISQEYQERAVLRSQLEERSQKYFELKARYEKEKSEWSEILARELQTHGILKSQLEELRPKGQRGWNPFRRDK